MAFKFEKIQIWQDAVAFASDIYELSRKYPKSEQYGLVNQLTRAAVSISLNIAEGEGRNSDTELARFLQISTGSLNEVVTILHISLNQQFITQQDFDCFYARCEELSKMLHGFKRYLKSPRL